MTLPVLYSFRRCPFAMRARMALCVSAIDYRLREIKLSDKPQVLFDLSAKATVPVLHLSTGDVIDESKDIMAWALQHRDPQQWLFADGQCNQRQWQLIDEFQDLCKPAIDRYKYPQRYQLQDRNYYRQQIYDYLLSFEYSLQQQRYLVADTPKLVDVALFPFVRQFAKTDELWFYQQSWQKLITWLDYFLQSALFLQVMRKYPLWHPDADDIVVCNSEFVLA